MLLGQIWYHWKAKSLRSMNPADANLDRWAVAMETASEVQYLKNYTRKMQQIQDGTTYDILFYIFSMHQSIKPVLGLWEDW